MKNTFKYLAVASVMLLGLSACQKTKAPAYEPAPKETGAQVFFPTAPAATVKLTKENPSLQIAVSRGNTADALDVAITAAGDATEWFNVPSKVSFGAGKKDATITISAKDVQSMEMNEFYPLSISLDNSLVSLYGASELSFNIGIELPWITFDTGTMVEGWWGEEEPGMPMKYQQITPTMRYCVVEGCWGHDTIAGGNDYAVQPYIWYWDTNTNYCYVPAQYMGYSTSSGDVYVADEAAFYNLYWNMQEAGKNGSGLAQGTDAWFEWCDGRRAAWAPDGDPFPYYSPDEGKFYLGDFFFLMADGQPTGSGYQFGGTQDMFVCSFAVNYTIGISYEGLLVDKNDEEQIMGELTIEGADVTDVYVVLVPGKDPNAAAAVLESGEEEIENCIILDTPGTFFMPMIADAEPGKYTIVAVPVDKNDAFAWDYAMFETFQYGPVLDPLGMDYTSDDFTEGVSMEELVGTEWVGYGYQLGNSGWYEERSSLGDIVVTDIEDDESGDDLITISGLSAGAGPYFGFDDSILCDLYNGIIYTHKTTNGSFDYSGTPLYVLTQWYDVAGDEVYNVNYAMIGAYVANGLIALVAYPNYQEKYGIVFGGLLYEAFTDEEFSEDGDMGTLSGVHGILLADKSIYSDGAAAISAAKKSISASKRVVNTLPAIGKHSFTFQPYDWSKDVVASGRVLSVKSTVETKINNAR